MDLAPFSAIGIAAETVRFLDIFLLHCLLSESPDDTPVELRSIATNKQQVATRGREPGLRLYRGTKQIELRRWASELLDDCAPIAAALDAACHSRAHQSALASARRALNEPESLPSARVLREIREQHGGSYARFVLAYSRRHREALKSEPLPAEVATHLAQLTEASLEQRRTLEAADTVPFETYRQRYLSPDSLTVDEPGLAGALPAPYGSQYR